LVRARSSNRRSTSNPARTKVRRLNAAQSAAKPL
jgi:hypothetical protein